MHVAGMKIGGIPPFTDQVEFEFHERVNVFIGPNAVGKTTALVGLSQIPSRPQYSSVVYGGDGVRWELSASCDWPRASHDQSANEDCDGLAPVWDKVPFVHVQATRLNLVEQTDLFGSPLSVDPVPADIGHKTIFVPLVATASYGREDAFDARVVRSAIDSLIESDRSYSGFRREQQIRSAIELGLRCTQIICQEIIVSSKPHDYEEDVGYLSDESGARAPRKIHAAMGIETIDPPPFGTPELVYAGNLSSGLQGTLMWVWLLTLKMVHHYDYLDGWESRPAILIIDEIENHLHPAWQRRMIPTLLDHFPGLQIFATTHSPFVVAGLNAGQVHLLHREANGVVRATTNSEAIEGWTADEILRVYMGVDDPTDKDTAEAAEQLRRLRDEKPRADEREEEARQTEMLRLRQIVNRAELSGPRAAEDARFLADLRSILERYSQAQNLNQEDG